MNMKVNLAGIELKNPVMTASGTFGSGEEYSFKVEGCVLANDIIVITMRFDFGYFCHRM